MLPEAPLSWPSDIRRNGKAGFLADMPLFGLHARVNRRLKSQLRARNAACIFCWHELGVPAQLTALVISPLIKDRFGWPNALFLPRDSCEVLFLDTTIELRFAAFIQELMLVINAPNNLYDEILERVAGMLYGEFILKVSSEFELSAIKQGFITKC